MQPDLHLWDAWSPAYLRDRMAKLDVPWGVAGGWALDLFRGAQSRPHDDLEIAIPATRFADVAALFADCEFFVPCDGLLHPVSPDMLAAEHQTWAREIPGRPAALSPRPATRDLGEAETPSGLWRFDIFREPHVGDTWVCRRNPVIRRRYADVYAETADGIPYVRPEIVLLFKAKAVRPKDTADWAGTLPLLSEDQRDWLRDGLELVHPGHPWLAALDRSGLGSG